MKRDEKHLSSWPVGRLGQPPRKARYLHPAPDPGALQFSRGKRDQIVIRLR
jgi:hypothetical protein